MARRRSMSDDKLERTAKRVMREACELLLLINSGAAAFALTAAGNLNDSKQIIYRMASKDRKEFFIELGKILEGKRRKPNMWSKLDWDVARILCFAPKIKSTDAVRILKEHGHPEISPGSFKQKKYNWRRAAEKTRRRLEKNGWIYRGNSFLDNAGA